MIRLLFCLIVIPPPAGNRISSAIPCFYFVFERVLFFFPTNFPTYMLGIRGNSTNLLGYYTH